MEQTLCSSEIVDMTEHLNLATSMGDVAAMNKLIKKDDSCVKGLAKTKAPPRYVDAGYRATPPSSHLGHA